MSIMTAAAASRTKRRNKRLVIVDSEQEGTSNDESFTEEDVVEEKTKKVQSEQRRRSRNGASSYRVLLFGLFACTLLMTTIVLLTAVSGRHLSKLTILKIVTLLPVALSLAIGVWPHRRRTLRRRILPLTLVASTVLGQLPVFVGAAMAATGLVLFSLATLSMSQDQAVKQLQQQQQQRSVNKEDDEKDKQQEQHGNNNNDSNTAHRQVLRVLGSAMLLVTVLLTENFMVWVVSATFIPGQTPQTAPEPLQDNGRWILEHYVFSGLTKVQVVGGLRRLWNVQWGLVACMAASLFILEIFPSSSSSSSTSSSIPSSSGHRPLYNKATRAVLTLAAARTIRTVSFLLTVLPSQSKYCYAQHYPYPPPSNTWDWIWVGLLPASHGGCNDLIISGHATVTSTLACISVSVAADEDPLFAVSLWSMVFLDYAVEIYEGFHYSVDMWLGMVLVSLLWNVLRFIEEDNSDRDRGATSSSTTTTTTTAAAAVSATRTKQHPLNSEPTLARFMKDVDTRTAALYILPALVVYLQLTVLPEATANFVIVAFCISVSVLYLGFARRQQDAAKHAAYQNYAQHVLLCLLFMALAIYL